MNNAKYTLASCFGIFSLIVVPIALFIVPIIYIDSWWLCVLVVTFSRSGGKNREYLEKFLSE